MLTKAPERLVGIKVWLEYYDQNSSFEEVFTPQFGRVIRQFTGSVGRDDWYLVKLEQPFHYNRLDRGGHFAAWEQPTLFTEELRAGFRSLRK